MYIYIDVYMTVSCSNCLPLFFLSCVCAFEVDLLEVSDYLLPLDKAQIHGLGLVLGLSHIRLKKMSLRHVSGRCGKIHAWLTRVDKVAERGGVSWGTLVAALRHSRVGQNSIADKIVHERISSYS